MDIIEEYSKYDKFSKTVVTNSGEFSVSINTGDHSGSINTGTRSAAINKGNHSASINTGDYSVAKTTGYYSVATNTGYRSGAKVKKPSSVAIVTGKESKAKGVAGSWIVLTERDDNWNILCVKAVKIDGKKFEENTWYTLKNKKVIEVV